MKKLAVILLSLGFFSSCNSQTDKANTLNNYEDVKGTSPNGNWEVHKEFDENGNLVRKDSTYSYSWSSVNGKQVNPQEMDSLMVNARKMMQAHMQNFSSFGFNSSFENDFFGESMMSMNPSEMRKKMMERMQKMQAQFFGDQNFPDELEFYEDQPSTETPAEDEVETEKTKFTTSSQQI